MDLLLLSNNRVSSFASAESSLSQYSVSITKVSLSLAGERRITPVIHQLLLSIVRGVVRYSCYGD